MIDIRILNRKTNKYVTLMQGTFSEIKDYVKNHPDVDPLDENGPGMDTTGVSGDCLQLKRSKKVGEYTLKSYDTDQILEGAFGDVMYAAVKIGWLKSSVMLQWTFKSDEYWDIQSREHTRSEIRICEFIDALEHLPVGEDMFGEIKWRPDTFKKKQ